MSTQVGAAACDFGFNTTTGGITISGTGVGTLLLQSGSVSNQAKVEEAMDSVGSTVQRAFYDQSQDASLEYVVKGSSITDAKAQATIPDPGSIVTITACASFPALVQTNWIVEPGVQMSKSNTSFNKVTLPLKRHAGITAITPVS